MFRVVCLYVSDVSSLFSSSSWVYWWWCLRYYHHISQLSIEVRVRGRRHEVEYEYACPSYYMKNRQEGTQPPYKVVAGHAKPSSCGLLIHQNLYQKEYQQ